jgi:hypothetical protein
VTRKRRGLARSVGFAHRGAELVERDAHARGESLAFVGEPDAASRSLDEPHAELRLERLDLVADRAVRDAELAGRAREAAQPRGRLERAQRLHRREPRERHPIC